MSPIRDQRNLDEMRKRLYERGANGDSRQRLSMSDIAPINQPAEPPAPKTWATPPQPVVRPEPAPVVVSPMAPTKRKRLHYRVIILLASFLFFFLVMAGTSLYLYFGNNQISSKNITVSMTGELTAGGGEEYPIGVTITNNNKVSIESAVLIVNFPSGTKSAEENPRDMLEERISLDRLNPGETREVPVKAIMYGEENQEHEVRATLEYRLIDSNGTFYKDADPLRFKIISSPLVIRISSVEKVSAGQETNITVTLQSNAKTPLKDLLLTAEYPDRFDFVSADPAPAYRENAWLIDELAPEQSTTIRIRGGVDGLEAEQFQIKFRAGTPQQSNQFLVGSTLAEGTVNFTIEQPFIDIGIAVNDSEGAVVSLAGDEAATVAVSLTNTLADTLYDVSLNVAIAGNIVVPNTVEVRNGYYDAAKNIIRFDPSGDSSLTQVAPGTTRTFSFTLKPDTSKGTPAFTVTANAFAERVREANANEELVATAKTEVKYTSSVTVGRQLGRGSAGFSESGPVPPEVGKATTYTVTLVAGAGGNDVTGGVVSTALPQYVNWTNQTTGAGTITFNPVTKEVTWNTGDIKAGTTVETSFQVSLTPSLTQVGDTPALITTQRFRATDRFTGAVVRGEAPPLNTELSSEAGFAAGNGEVVEAE